ncbi:MAG TPA: FecR domain-containing protein [Spirochaetia bacterium]|nr:FecR domain-containing protein [Spirochaetia bacterium]
MRRARLLPIAIALIGLGAVSGLAAPGENQSVGLIVYAEGETITILRERVQVRLDAGVGDALGEPLYAGDQVSTAAGTFAEIQLLSSSNIVKVAENTTFVVEALARGESTLRLTYGRLRARVEQIAGAGRFEMRGITAVAGVRGTDFGYDQYVDPVSGELLDRIYCLEGEIRVSSVDDPSLAIDLPAGRMLVVRAGAAPDSVVVTPLDEAITRYWEARPFSRDIASARRLVQEFPALAGRVESDLGTLPDVLVLDEPVVQTPAAAPDDATPEEQPAEPQPDVEAQRIEPSVVIEAEPAVDEEAEQRARVARGLRTTGIVLAGTGLLIDIAAVGLYYFGDDIFAGWTAENNAILGPVAATGVGLLAGGIIAIMISLGVNN